MRSPKATGTVAALARALIALALFVLIFFRHRPALATAWLS
jgi:hypothetical protein